VDPALFDLNAEIEQSHWWFSGRRQIMGSLLDEVMPSRSGVVIDVGCGTGATIASLSDRYECAGIDPSEVAIDHARRRFPGVNFLHGAGPGGLGDLATRADAFLLMDVLEHVEDDRELLFEVVELLPPGGHILITVPADMRLWSEHDVSHGHYRRYDPQMLRAVWHGLPVTERLVSHFNSRLYPVVRVLRALSKSRGHAGGEGRTDLSMPIRPANAALRRIFRGESRRLVRALDSSAPGYRRGVSLIAVLRHEVERCG
jgi:SAM-dependent methyltransferase